MPTTLDETMQQALDGFDYVKVARVYGMLAWRWRDEGVPDAAALRKEATSIMASIRAAVARDGLHRIGISSGGLFVDLGLAEEGWQVILRFVCEQAQSTCLDEGTD